MAMAGARTGKNGLRTPHIFRYNWTMEYALFLVTDMLVRRVVWKGAGVADIAGEFRIMGLFAFLTIETAILGYHKRS